MPFLFDPTKYHNTYPGEFGDSPLQPSQNNPGQEVWAVKVYRLKHDEATNSYQKYNQSQPCQICGDSVNHQHYWYYESEKPNSPAAQFVFSLRDKGGLVINDPAQIVGKQFQFEEKTFKGGINPSTGQPGRDRTYGFVIGPVGFEPPEEINEQEVKSGAPDANNQPVGGTNTPPATAQTTQQPVAAAPVSANGTDDLLKRLARISDGKADLDAIRSEAKSDAAIFDNKQFFISVLNGTAFTEMVSRNYAVKNNETGIFSSVV